VTPRELAYAFWQLLESSDIDAAQNLLHPEYVEIYPQSGERISGPANFRAILDNYPGGQVRTEAPLAVVDTSSSGWVLTPGYTVVRVEESGAIGTAVVKCRYPDGSEWWTISLFEVKDDLIYRITTYFAEPFEAPDWRAQWVERVSGDETQARGRSS